MKKQLTIFQNSISSVQEYPVNLSQIQEIEKEKKMIDTSGHTCLKSLNKKNPLISLSKMLLTTSMWHSMNYVMTWKIKCTPHNRLVFQLAASKHLIKETDYSVWPTPTAQAYKGGRTLKRLKEIGRKENNSLADAVNYSEGHTGQINPEFVEYLMGFPIGWTELKD